MITTTTYRDKTVHSRDLLAAFSPLDHSTTAQLSADQVAGAYAGLLRRLAVLAFQHGADAPAHLLSHLASADANADVVEAVAAFLDGGTDAVADPSQIQREPEIQQELVHFSRIVDIGRLGLGNGAQEEALRRLRGSQRLPDPMKVLAELTVLTRSRLAQRGRSLPAPWLRPGAAVEADHDDLTTATHEAGSDYWVAVRSQRRRTRRDLRYHLSALLEYLTPVEAAMVLWAHCHAEQRGHEVELAVVQADPVGGVSVASWFYRPGPDPQDNLPAHVAETLPRLSTLQEGQALTVCGHTVSTAGKATATVTQPGTPDTVVSAPPRNAVALQTMAARACDLLADYNGPDLLSIEAGHIHLDRNLDVDQETGTAIGVALLGLLATRQHLPPVLTPMMDDDHVLVRLTPDAYRVFLGRTFGDTPMHLIVESSPIIRAIVGVLFQRLRHSKLARDLQRRGGNLFLPLPDGNHCELFEDIDGTPITGCVFFETALLVYRSAPARFDRYFTDRYRLDTGVHDQAAEIISASSDGGHDAVAAALAAYYTRFDDVTYPHRPDPHIAGLVTHVLDGAHSVLAHLNVLEDYYEVQQERVRALLRRLGLPVKLVSVHFSAATGRVVLAS